MNTWVNFVAVSALGCFTHNKHIVCLWAIPTAQFQYRLCQDNPKFHNFLNADMIPQKKKKFHTKNYFHAQTLKFCLRVSSDDVYNMKKMQESFRVYTQELFPRCVPSTSLQYAWMASIRPTALQKLSKTHKFESPSSRCCALRSIISIFANPGRHWKSDQFFFLKFRLLSASFEINTDISKGIVDQNAIMKHSGKSGAVAQVFNPSSFLGSRGRRSSVS